MLKKNLKMPYDYFVKILRNKIVFFIEYIIKNYQSYDYKLFNNGIYYLSNTNNEKSIKL